MEYMMDTQFILNNQSPDKNMDGTTLLLKVQGQTSICLRVFATSRGHVTAAAMLPAT